MWRIPRSHTAFALITGLLLAATSAFAQEAELLDVLGSNASIAEKSAACRQLARIATKDSVPTLASLLADEKLSHMARYALESIQDPSVDVALRRALGELQGTQRLGVIGSLGARRDAGAVEALAALLTEKETAPAAARALGNIGNDAAAKALQESLSSASANSQLAVCEGLLRCAEALADEGQAPQAQGLYDFLREQSNTPPQVAAAALRGAILSRGKDGVPLLIEAIHGPDYAMAAAAIRAAMESPAAEIADALVAELPKASDERKGLLIVALADRGDARVLPTVLEVAQSAEGQLRVLAFRALKRVGDASCVPALLEAAAEGSDEVTQAAMESLESLQDEAVDGQVVESLADATGKMRTVLIDLAGRRRTAAATPALWQAADDDDSEVRAAALKALGAIVETADLPKLISRLAETEDKAEAAALDHALQEVGLRSADRDAVAKQLADAMPKASGPVQSRILDSLYVVGGAVALETVANTAQSKDVEIRDAAYRVLGRWRSEDAAPALLKLHNSVTEGKLKVRVIRAYIRIARQFDMPAERRAEMCRTALKMAERDTDKRLVLEVLLRYPSPEMRAIALEAAEDPALKDQAMLVVMGMASKGVSRAELGKILAQAGQKPVKVEIIEAKYGAGDKVKDVTEVLRKHTKNYRVIFLPNSSYNQSLGGDPAPGTVKELKVKYRIDGKPGEVTLTENATIVLPMPK